MKKAGKPELWCPAPSPSHEVGVGHGHCPGTRHVMLKRLAGEAPGKLVEHEWDVPVSIGPAGAMGRHDDIRQGAERVTGGRRLPVVHVEDRGKPLFAEFAKEGISLNDGGASGIDQHGAVFDSFQKSGIDHSLGLFRE